MNNAPINGLEETISIDNECNVFRKDEVKQTSTLEELLQNAPDSQNGMFKIPKGIN